MHLFDDSRRIVFKICWAYTRTEHDRDDLYQEIVGQLWASFGRYDRSRKFSTWMCRIALNVAIDSVRRRKSKVAQTSSLEESAEPTIEPDTVKISQSEILRELLEQQDDADKALLLLYLDGNSYRDISEVLGISESNVGTRINRLKQALRESVNNS